LERNVWRKLFTVATNGFDRASGESFFAERTLVIRLGLLVNVGVAAVIVALEVGWRGLAAQVTVNALIIHVVRAYDVLGVFVCGVGHLVLGLVKGGDSKVS
jgi:hypothetical protein